MKTSNKLNKKGLSLAEIIVVIAIISILAAIAVPGFIKHIEKSREEVCKFNCSQLERTYKMHLQLEGIEHNEIIFRYPFSGF